MFTSNNSHRTTCSVIRSSFVENSEGGKNAVSFVVGNSSGSKQQESTGGMQPQSPLNGRTFKTLMMGANQGGNGDKRKEMYTFGGLMTPLLDQTHDLKHSTTIPSPTHQHPSSPSRQSSTLQPSPLLSNQINTKSID